MNLLLVRPRPEKETIGLQHVMIVEPLELEILGACKRFHDEVVICDMIIEKGPVEQYLTKYKTDVVCITGYITNIGTIKDICKRVKNYNKEIITVVGGVHCEVCPDDFNDPAIDYRVVRNAVTYFTELLDHIEYNYPLPPGVLTAGAYLNEIELLPIDFRYVTPDRSLTSEYRNKYFYIFQNKVALIKATFGCPFNCNFCFCRKITREQYWQRNVEEVVTELETIKEKEIYIVDDDFLADRRYVEAFLTLLEKRNIKKRYLIYGRADFIVKNPELLSRFRKLGLRTIIVGFESFFEEELKSFGKNIDARTNYEAMNVLNKLNIDCYATIILSPDWNKEQFRKLELILKQLKIHYVNLQPLTPLPGTDFHVPAEKLMIKEYEYAKWDLAHLSIIPSKMSVAEYYKELLRLYGKVIFQSWIIRKYFKNYSIRMLIKVSIGSLRVRYQYNKKIREAVEYDKVYKKEELLCPK